MTTGADAGESAPRTQPRKRFGGLRIGAVVALGAAVGFAAWLILRDDDSTPATEAPPPAASPSPPTSTVSEVSVRELRTLARSLRRPIYWAGPRRRMKMSLRRTSDGRLFVRYLPLSARVGDPRPRFLVVATYPVEDAFAATQNAASAPDSITRRVARGGIVYYSNGSPTNVYLAYPGGDYQIEVFHPDPRTALRLVTSGRVKPIR